MTLSMICPSLSASGFREINLQRLGLISDISFKLAMPHYIMYILYFISSSDPVYFYMKPCNCLFLDALECDEHWILVSFINGYPLSA